MSQEKIKHCPFFKTHKAVFGSRWKGVGVRGDEYPYATISCPKCDVEMSAYVRNEKELMRLIKRWNTRVGEKK